MPTLTLDYDPETSGNWPPMIELLESLQIEYDEDDCTAKAPNGDQFKLSIYPRAGCIRFDSDGEYPEALFIVLLNLPPSDTKVRVLIQEDEHDEGVSIALPDFIASLLQEETA